MARLSDVLLYCKPVRAATRAVYATRRAPAPAAKALTTRVLSSTASAVRGCGASATLPRSPYPDEAMRSFLQSKRISTLTVLLLSAIYACGGGGSSTSNGITNPNPVTSSTTSLTVSNNKYTPAHDSVGVGANLSWTWDSCTGDGYGGSTCTSHSVTFDDGPTSSIQSSGSFSRMFASAGTYTYHCKVHGAAMSGTVLVK